MLPKSTPPQVSPSLVPVTTIVLTRISSRVAYLSITIRRDVPVTGTTYSTH